MPFHPRSRKHARLLGVVIIAGLAGLGWSAPALAKGEARRINVTGSAAPGRIAPLRDKRGLLRPKTEKAIRLSNARVVLADYGLIRHDFGDALAKHFGKPLPAISNEEVDGWLLDSAAYVSMPQTHQTDVNTPIPTAEHVVTAFRPHDYGRALVFEPTPGVLIDVKGSGARKPKQTDHGNGLATLGEVVREFAYEQLVTKVFQHAHEGLRTAGHYAVIDAGFDVKWPDGKTDPAGLILRQAHVRAPGDKSSFNKQDSLRIETTLRHYGITSAGAYQNEPWDAINVQGTAEGGVLDFGGFLVMPKFEKPAYHFDFTPDLSKRYKPLMAPGQGFVQADDRLRAPVDRWGFTVSGRADPVADNPWIWSHELARSLREGRATRHDAETHLHNLMGPVEERLH